MTNSWTAQTHGILFDMDGVLVSSIASVRRCWRQWAEHYRIADPESIEIPHGTRAIEVMRLLKPDIDVEEGLRLIEDLEVADVADTRVLSGARELLASLPPDRWTIVTSATRPLVVSRLRAAGLQMPDTLVTAESVERGKPDPQPYRIGARVLGLTPAECLVIEDAVSGVQAGVAAGCRVLGVVGTYSPQELRAAGAAWVIHSLREIDITISGAAIGLRVQGTPYTEAL